jgi:DNA repair protein RecO (recombination protein O)
MEWRDDGIILAVRGHGETSAIAEIFTAEHGRTLGLVRGGRSRRMRPVLQPGNAVELTWRARLEEHLGHMTLEPTALRAGFIIENALRLSGLASLTALAQVLPEREPHRKLYDAMRIVLEAIDHDEIWPALLVRWEMGLLDELGFGLDLSKCASTGEGGDLIYVSPKSGKAVSAGAGAPYAGRLLMLPAFLMGGSGATPGEIQSGFALTGYFLERHVFGPRNMAVPQARSMLMQALVKSATTANERPRD